MTYEDALAYLHSLQRFGMKPGLARTQELLRRVGRPDRRCGRIIHITGTSGKGSVAALVESGLRAAGYRVGLYTSPSLMRFTDRIQIDRQEIATEEVAALVAQVAPHVTAMVAEGLEQPTEFEVITTVALLAFASHQVDYLVLEVGLGGRFDATTAAETPVLTCITNIGLDHTEWLGPTHEAIAEDKSGIIRPGIPCVTGTTHPGALQVIQQAALAESADLIEVAASDAVVVSHGPEGQMVDLLGARGWYRQMRLALLGRHQAANAAVALRLLELAGLPEQAIRTGFERVVWPGRFEVVRIKDGPTVVLDAAHNPAKCSALAETVREYFPDRPVSLVLGILADKNAAEMLPPLLALAGRVLTVTPESPRRLEAEKLAGLCAGFGHTARSFPAISGAIDEAIQNGAPAEIVLVTGSFYTVGPARRYLEARAIR